MDIVERLRQLWNDRFSDFDFAYAKEAADEIERLRGALSAIAISYSKDMPDGIDAKMMWIGCTQIARVALQQKESK